MRSFIEPLTVLFIHGKYTLWLDVYCIKLNNMKDSGCVCIKLWSSVAWIHNNPMCIEILHIRMYQIFVISLDLIWAFEFYESHTSVRITEHCSEGSYAYTPLSYGVIQYLLSGRCDRQTAINLCHKFYCKRLGLI